MANHQKIVIEIHGCAKAEAFRKQITDKYKLRSTKAQTKGSSYMVMIYGDIDDATYEEILSMNRT